MFWSPSITLRAHWHTLIADHSRNAYCSGGERCDLVYVGDEGAPDWTPAEALARLERFAGGNDVRGDKALVWTHPLG